MPDLLRKPFGSIAAHLGKHGNDVILKTQTSRVVG